MNAKLMWITPEADKMIGYMARVSNPTAKLQDPTYRLIKYLIDHSHWSPFEMANMCVEINTTRDISRQILRHRSFSFQEFSQRYAEVPDLISCREMRLQDPKNRQNSIETDDKVLSSWWELIQDEIQYVAKKYYKSALEKGIAKEVARAILPEGLTPTKMYMNGTMRSWLHYFSVRIGNGTQKEHDLIANQIWTLFQTELPDVAKAFALYESEK